MTDGSALAGQGRPGRAALLLGLFTAEILLLAVAYQFFAQIECRATDAQATCDFLRSLVARALVVIAVVLILLRARPQAFSAFLSATVAHRGPAARAVHLAGLGLLFVPLVMAWGDDLGAMFDYAVVPWIIGAIAGAAGGLLWLAPVAAWRSILSQDGYAPVPILLAAALVPDLAETALPLWDLGWLTAATFLAVAGLLRIASPAVEASAADYIIGVDGFFVHIARQCSGVEGFALTAAFVLLYAFIFRREVRLVRFLLVVLPLGLLLSWMLNVVRIAVLVLIGARLSPDLAVNGFHSYAGWLFFTLLAFALVMFVQASPWLHHRGAHGVPGPGLRQDGVAAAILPFVAFMVTATFLSAMMPVPGLGFPLVTLVLAGACALFLPVYRSLDWRADPVAIAVGAIVGVAWVATAGAPDLRLEAGIAGMPAMAFAIWAGLRVLGTVVFVPLVEEMFFRGYLLARLDGPVLWRRVMAVVLSSLAFGALHGRYVEAGLAGIAFALVTLRKGRVADAVLAHIVANAVVAGWALWLREWSLI